MKVRYWVIQVINKKNVFEHYKKNYSGCTRRTYLFRLGCVRNN